MLKKLRLKFVCITMAIVTAMLVIILGLVLHSTARNLEQQSLQMLYEAASDPVHMGRPGEKLRLPYFALEVNPGGTVMVIGGDAFDLSDEAVIADILAKTTSTRKNTGTLPEYNLRYYRTMGMRGESIYFADISGERQTLKMLNITCVIVGAAAFAALLGGSFLLAGWAVKPVEKAWQEQRQFVADASHELKTPLTVILTNAELLAEAPHGPHSDRFIGSIQSMAQQMRGLVESLLELVRVGNETAKKSFQDVCWSETVCDAVLPFEALFYEAGLTLEVQIEPGIRVYGSAGHLRQVVEILLDNAQKYAQPQTCVFLTLQKSGSRDCLLKLSNTGAPMSREDLENIFHRFYRGDKARTMNHSYGLGLPIAKTILEEHKGKIWAESKEGLNTFFVQLPMIN